MDDEIIIKDLQSRGYSVFKTEDLREKMAELLMCSLEHKSRKKKEKKERKKRGPYKKDKMPLERQIELLDAIPELQKKLKLSPEERMKTLGADKRTTKSADKKPEGVSYLEAKILDAIKEGNNQCSTISKHAKIEIGQVYSGIKTLKEKGYIEATKFGTYSRTSKCFDKKKKPVIDESIDEDTDDDEEEEIEEDERP